MISLSVSLFEQIFIFGILGFAGVSAVVIVFLGIFFPDVLENPDHKYWNEMREREEKQRRERQTKEKQEFQSTHTYHADILLKPGISATTIIKPTTKGFYPPPLRSMRKGGTDV